MKMKQQIFLLVMWLAQQNKTEAKKWFRVNDEKTILKKNKINENPPMVM